MSISERLNSAIRQHYGDDTELSVQARHLALQTAALIGLIIVLPAFFVREIMQSSTASFFLLLAIGSFTASGLIIVLILRGYFATAKFVFASSAFLFPFVSILFSGGVPRSELTPYVAIVPMVFFRLYGTRIGYISIAGVSVFAFLLYAANPFLDGIFPNLIGQAEFREFGAFVLIFSTILLEYCGQHSQTVKLRKMLDAEKQKLARLATQDALTNIANVHSFNEKLDSALATRSGQETQPFHILYVDLNAFKAINDTYGHQAGDHVLQVVSLRLNHLTRDGDMAARLGGDEFALFLAKELTKTELDALVERVGASIAKPMSVNGLKLHVTASLGLVSHPENGTTRQGLMKAVDERMYADKETHKQKRNGPQSGEPLHKRAELPAA